jgi:DNA-binding NtrC family response regulator
MEAERFNILVVDDDEAMVFLLRNYLRKHFGNCLNIQTFNNGETCLDHINDRTDLVILDYYLKDQNGAEVLESIKMMNPLTEVIVFSSSEDITAAIESFRKGAKDYIRKDTRSLGKIALHIHKMLTEPISIFAKEIGVSKYIA